MSSSPPVILTIAGSDCCAGAGLQADLKAISAHGGYGVCAVTAIVSEVPGIVSKVQTVDSHLLADQLRMLIEHYPLSAIKTGMLANRELVKLVAEFLHRYSARKIPLVVDPVMVATSGDRLLDDDAIEVYRSEILPLATVATPNLGEAAALLNRDVSTISDMENAARDFYQHYHCSVILKGGHLSADEDATDLLFDGREVTRQSAPRIPDIDTHGTGCTFSAALATLLGAGHPLPEAFRLAKSYITRAIAESHHWPQPGDIHALNHQPENVA
jgi:hydroxymethylpyrimidine/phosphomethylpyrimidine kinase